MAEDIQDLLEDSVYLQCRVNGQLYDAEIHPTTSLLDFLRDELRLTGTHMGCMTGHCGACTVLIDGKVAKSCLTPAASMQRKTVTTLEGLANKGDLHDVQSSFVEESGFQCGYCAPGMVLTTVELLQSNPTPTDAEIRQALVGNLCRCTGYQSIIRAVRKATANLSADPT